MTAKHTPLVFDTHCGEPVLMMQGLVVAEIIPANWTKGEAKAFGAKVARSFNAHEALVAVVRRLKSWQLCTGATGTPALPEPLYAELVAALKLAEAKP